MGRLKLNLSDFSGPVPKKKYRHIQPKLFFGYHADGRVLSAYPEKALLDLFYFTSYGLETVSFAELDLSHINKKRWLSFKKFYPSRLQPYFKKLETLFV